MRTRDRLHRPLPSMLLAILAAGLLAAAGTAHPGEVADAEALLERVAPTLVTVRYVLEQEGGEFGGFTQRSHLRAHGILAREDGLVVLGGEIWPQEELTTDDTIRLVDFEVVLSSGEVVGADLVGLDDETNLAFVKTRADGPFPWLTFAEGEPARIGEQVLAVGRLAEGFGGTPHLKPVFLGGLLDGGSWVLGDILDRRFLGGPLLDLEGQGIGLVGIEPTPPGVDPQQDPEYFPTFVATVPQGKRFGLPVGLPAARFAKILEDPPPVPGPGAEERAWIGITLQPVSRALAEHWGMTTPSGIAVTSVIEGSPAERAGLREGDVIVSFGGDPVRAEEESDLDRFIRKVQRAGVEKAIELEVFRRGRVRDLSMTLGRAPMPMHTAPSYTSRDFGMKVRNLTFDFLQRRNLPRDLEGVLVEELESGGWAQVGGLREGDVIRAVQQRPVQDVDSLRDALARMREEKRREVVFFVQRGPNTTFVAVRTDY